jgi:diadenosine tetraphosphate (Ap4A) HIT family hydrolase
MITESNYLLVAREETLDDIRFEAIERITDESQILDVWRRNKTPLIVENGILPEIDRKYPTLRVPEYIFGPEDFIAFCHRNKFECGEYVSGNKFDTSKDRCFLCDIANHMDIKGPLYLYNKTTKLQRDMIIYESEHFFVKIELGCLKKGFLMICPKEHVLSAARIPEENMQEYYQVMKDIEFLLKAVYGDDTVLFFEHGSAPDGISSHKRSIVHAHTHVVWGIKFDQKYLDMVCLKPVSNIKVSKDKKYFSYQEGTDGKLMLVNDPNVYVQRQYPRQVIGLMLGIENEKTNWRKEEFSDNMTKTFNDIYNFLKASQSFLSDRILKATDGFVKGYPLRSDFSKKF